MEKPENTIFNEDNFRNLRNTSCKIMNLIDEQQNGSLMWAQMVFLGDLIRDFATNPIVLESGIITVNRTQPNK